jgi:hypothetical protein
MAAEYGGEWNSARADARWVPVRASLVGLREKSQKQSIVMIVAMEILSHCSRHPRSLGKNNIGDTGTHRLVKALACNTTLQTLE